MLRNTLPSVAGVLADAGCAVDCRPQELSLAQFVRLFELVGAHLDE